MELHEGIRAAVDRMPSPPPGDARATFQRGRRRRTRRRAAMTVCASIVLVASIGGVTSVLTGTGDREPRPSVADAPETPERTPSADDSRTDDGRADAGVVPLLKEAGWREDLTPPASHHVGILEIAFDAETAQRAWDENAPDTTQRRQAAADVNGVFGDLEDLDLERQALVVWSGIQSPTCPTWLTDVVTTDGRIHLVHDGPEVEGGCRASGENYRMVLAIDRERLPSEQDLPTEGLQDLQEERANDVLVHSYPYEAGTTVAWMHEDEKRAYEAEHGEVAWTVAYFHASDTMLADALSPWWRRSERSDQQPEERLAEALEAMTGPPPPETAITWQGQHLDLRAASLEGSELVLDLAETEVDAPGTAAADLLRDQLEATAFHHFPGAEELCVLIDGEPSVWLHDMLTCPSRELPEGLRPR